MNLLILIRAGMEIDLSEKKWEFKVIFLKVPSLPLVALSNLLFMNSGSIVVDCVGVRVSIQYYVVVQKM